MLQIHVPHLFCKKTATLVNRMGVYLSLEFLFTKCSCIKFYWYWNNEVSIVQNWGDLLFITRCVLSFKPVLNWLAVTVWFIKEAVSLKRACIL
jgi:hypothetical protein